MAKWRIRGSALPFPSPSIKQRALVKQTNKQHSQQYFVPPNDVRRSFQTAKKKRKEHENWENFCRAICTSTFSQNTEKSNTNGRHNNIFGSVGGQVCVVMLHRCLQWPYPTPKSAEPRTFNMGTRWETIGQGLFSWRLQWTQLKFP